jgi:lipid II:glycine glycyltransferase (peptidoglycan interpeptide bridge formation enzyme)
MIQVREISDSERDYWDNNIQHFKFAHPLNAYGWGKVRSVDNWSPIYLVAENQEKLCGAMMILVKKIPYTSFSIFYSPRGPVWDYGDDETLTKLIEKAREVAKREKAIFLRVDPSIPESIISSIGDKLASIGFIHLEQRWNFWNTPRDVYRIDLTKVNSAEEFFDMLDRDTRRCIRKAAKEGVSIGIATNEGDLKAVYVS